MTEGVLPEGEHKGLATAQTRAFAGSDSAEVAELSRIVRTRPKDCVDPWPPATELEVSGIADKMVAGELASLGESVEHRPEVVPCRVTGHVDVHLGLGEGRPGKVPGAVGHGHRRGGCAR